MKKYGYNHSNKPVIAYGKQVNGYFVVVEEVRTGKSDLAFFTMRKTKGQLQEGALILAKDKLPALRPKSLPSYDETITNNSLKNQKFKLTNEKKSSIGSTRPPATLNKETIINPSLKDAEDKTIEDISFEELDKKGLIPFANGHTLGAGFFGGSEALYNQRDYNNDGKTDIEDIAIGALGGVIGFKALAKMFPKWFADDIVSNSINSNKLNKEKKNISKVAFGEKPSTIIRAYDKDSLDKLIIDNKKTKNNIEFEKGGFNEYTKKGVGFEKIAIRHMQDGSDGYISLGELTKIGEVIRDGEFKLKSNGLREYTYFDKDIRYKAIVGDKNNNERVVSFYSNRRGKGHDARILFGNPPKDSIGLEHNAQDYGFLTNTDGIIITYKPKTTFKQWLLDLKKQSKDIKGLANEEEIKHLGKISLDGIKTLAKNSKERLKKLNTGTNRNIVTKEALKQNNQSIKRSERRYKNK